MKKAAILSLAFGSAAADVISVPLVHKPKTLSEVRAMKNNVSSARPDWVPSTRTVTFPQ